ncbi:rhodanese-like domain-containing protein [Chitinivibrio alkaliphilus]|uniref:Rhodanese domain protein n=1 Tax=Chitinivibrio alkaliphilus ACht1 TaxID=1313304 RepID=U7D7U0_9BACT|nr:rhodanese-like domain-containing protein [Chitinivibrio alkaliphilus]ERP39020.1 rhodanese domain protein [Chitinivibrio alkaliphilus ACht1]
MRQKKNVISGTVHKGIRRIRVDALDESGIGLYRGDSVQIYGDLFARASAIESELFSHEEGDAPDFTEGVSFTARDTGRYTLHIVLDTNTSVKLPLQVLPFQSTEQTRYREISSAEMEQYRRQGNPVLDVRTEQEFSREALSGAIHIPLHELEQRIHELHGYEDAPILVYCRSGNRSTVAANILLSHGFSAVYNLEHGIIEWRRDGREVVP